MEPGSPKMLQFTHLIVEAKSKYSPNLKPYARTHNILASVDGFAEIAMNHQIFPPVRIKTKPLIFILERNFDAVPEIDEESAEESFERQVASEIKIDSKELPPIPESQIIHEPESVENEEENVSDEPENETSKNTIKGTSNESQETVTDENNIPEQETEAELENDPMPETEPELDEPQMQTNEARNEYYEYDEDGDDLLATESNERLVESLDFRPVVEDLEERLKSNSGNIDEVLLNDDVLSYIKALTKVEYNGPEDIDKLRKALSSILSGFKDVEQNDDEH